MSGHVSQADLDRALLSVFGHGSFRPGQREIIEALVARRDALAIMPTGAGKSVTFQLPARLGLGPVLVVSPLLALMRDQVEGARRRGLRASWVESALDPAERRRRLAGLADGSVEILYVAPESLEGVVDSIGCDIGLLAVDEAHCISQWGHDFRPSYRLIGEARRKLGGVTTIAVTATATLEVADDIAGSLALADPFVWRGSFLRPNLRLATLRKDALTDTEGTILASIRAHEGQAAVVYCLSRRRAGTLASALRSRGVAAVPYHAGMDARDRAEVQDAFCSGAAPVVVATVAFGMGIDKADVRLIAHADLPGSIEAYAQEIGRAGRDGLVSDCLMLYSWDDVRRRLALTRRLPRWRRRQVSRMLGQAFRFASGGRCRHVRLCEHFGERVSRCARSCDICGGPSALAMMGGPDAVGRW